MARHQKKAHWLWALFVAASLLLAGCDNIPEPLPEPTLYVTPTPHIDDPNGVLRIMSPILEEQAQSFYDDLGIEVRVVVAASAQGDMTRATKDTFARLDLESTAPTGAILIFLSPLDNEAHIAVSRSLEGSLTDAVVGPIAKAQLEPYVSYNMIGMAMMDTLTFLKNYALTAAANQSLPLKDRYIQRPQVRRAVEIAAAGGGGQTRILSAGENDRLKGKPPADQLNQYLPGDTPLKSIAALERVLHDMVGYPFLELYTQGGQVIRDRYPHAPHEQWERYVAMRDSAPFNVLQQDNYAVVISDTPAIGLMPIALKRVDGLWRVDESEMFKSLFFTNDGGFFLRNNNTPYVFGLPAWGEGINFDVAALDVNLYDSDGDLHAALAAASKLETAEGEFLYAELLFRNGFAALPSLPHYEAAVALNKTNLDYRITLVDRYDYAYLINPAQPHILWLKIHAREMAKGRPDTKNEINSLNNTGHSFFWGKKGKLVSHTSGIYLWEMSNAVRRNKFASKLLCRHYSLASSVFASPVEAIAHCKFALNEYLKKDDTAENRRHVESIREYLARAEALLARSDN